MIWVILAVIGVPLWLCALAIGTLVLRNRSIRNRPGNVPCRIRKPGGKRWLPGHGVWVHDVFAFRGSPAAWKEALLWAIDVSVRPASPEERKKLYRLGAEPVVATLTLASRGSIEIAARADDEPKLRGPSAYAPPGARTTP